MSGLLSFFFAVVVYCLTFFVVVTPHEAGHFLVGRLLRARPEEFSVGIGPRVVARRWGGVLYVIRWIPIAAYVRMPKDFMETVASWRKVLIYAAGPAASLAAAYGFYALAELAYRHDLWRAIQTTNKATLIVLSYLGGHFGELFNVSSVSGPVGMGQSVAQSTSGGLVSWLVATCSFSVGVALFNLLPIGPLDGGGILSSIVEILAGRHLPRLVLGFRAAGVVALLGIVAYATAGDLWHLLSQ